MSLNTFMLLAEQAAPTASDHSHSPAETFVIFLFVVVLMIPISSMIVVMFDLDISGLATPFVWIGDRLGITGYAKAKKIVEAYRNGNIVPLLLDEKCDYYDYRHHVSNTECLLMRLDKLSTYPNITLPKEIDTEAKRRAYTFVHKIGTVSSNELCECVFLTDAEADQVTALLSEILKNEKLMDELTKATEHNIYRTFGFLAECGFVTAKEIKAALLPDQKPDAENNTKDNKEEE